MTDFTALLVADRGQAAPPIHLVDKASFDDWLKHGRPRTGRCSKRSASTARGFACLLPRGGEFEVVARGQGRWRVIALVPRQAAESLPEGTYGSPAAGRGRPVLGWLLGQYRFDRYRTGEEAARPARPAHRRAGADRRDRAARRSDRPGPRPRQHARRRSRPRRARGGGAALWPTRPARRSASPRDHALDEGYPMIAAVGAAAAPSARAAADRAGMGQARRTRGSRSSARASASIRGGLDLKPPPACG